MKINMKQFRKWIEALDSGKYKKATKYLNTNKGYCCLGVACDVLIPQGKIKRIHGYIYGRLPDDQEHSPEWLKSINHFFMGKVGKSLSQLNDSTRITFPQIATLLELVYIHKALK